MNCGACQVVNTRHTPTYPQKRESNECVWVYAVLTRTFPRRPRLPASLWAGFVPGGFTGRGWRAPCLRACSWWGASGRPRTAQLPCCSPRWPCLGTSGTVKLQGKAWPSFAGQLNNVSSGSAIYPPCAQRSQVLFILQVLPLFWGLNVWGLFIRLYCNTWYLFEFTPVIWISDLASSLSVFV